MSGLRTAALAIVLVTPGAALAQDVLGVAEIGGLPGQTRDVPVTVRDVGGSALDEGDGPDLEIQGFAFRVDFAPAEQVTAVTFLQSGVTAGCAPLFPYISPQPDHIVVLMSFAESSDPLPFTLDRAPPGDVVGLLRFTLAGDVPLETLITLTLVEENATLVNDAGTLIESVANGQLALDHGSILITPNVFASGFESGDWSDWSTVVSN